MFVYIKTLGIWPFTYSIRANKFSFNFKHFICISFRRIRFRVRRERRKKKKKETTDSDGGEANSVVNVFFFSFARRGVRESTKYVNI